MVDRRKPKRSRAQPRIPGVCRIPAGDRFLPEVAAGLDAIAAREGWSRARVVAWIVSDYFNLDHATGEPAKGRC